jgi:hypothetical protein
MARIALAVGLVGGFVIGIADLNIAAAWTSFCLLVGLCVVVDSIDDRLKEQCEIARRTEMLHAYRFDRDFPDAPKNMLTPLQQERAAQQQRQFEAAAEQARRAQAKAAAAAAQEKKRKAAEPTFVSRELVPEVPEDFKPTSSPAEVDFSAIEEVAKPRRRRE